MLLILKTKKFYKLLTELKLEKFVMLTLKSFKERQEELDGKSIGKLIVIMLIRLKKEVIR